LLIPQTKGNSPNLITDNPLATDAKPSGKIKTFLLNDRVEPWRDWAILAVVIHGILLATAIASPGFGWIFLIAIPLGLILSTAVLTVEHDAGHRRFGKGLWPNIFATQTAAPVGLWVVHWTKKHQVHHKVTQVYPLDDATRASGLVRLHPSAPYWHVHRFQHLYAWFLYGLAWAGELRSQVNYMRTGELAGVTPPPHRERVRSFALEKLICGLVLLPYIIILGPAKLAFLMLIAMTVASMFAAVVLSVGHIAEGLTPGSTAPRGREEWEANLVRTSASFNTKSHTLHWITGGLTHHLAHHLRAGVSREDLKTVHQNEVVEAARASGIEQVEYPTLTSAVIGHRNQLRALGRADAVMPATSEQRVAVQS
jgi:linoleoyl-CoA desaturase